MACVDLARAFGPPAYGNAPVCQEMEVQEGEVLRRITEWIVEPTIYVYIDTCMKLCIYIHLYSHIPCIHIYITWYNMDSEIWYHDISYQTNRDLVPEELFIVSGLPLPWYYCTCIKCASAVQLCRQKKIDTLPETNSKSTWKWMVGSLSRFLLRSPIFRSKLLVSGSVQCKPLGTGVAISFWTK